MRDAGLFHAVEAGKTDSPSDKRLYGTRVICSLVQAEHNHVAITPVPGSWLLTWMREVHFWLYDHPLGRQWGWALTVGVDWSLELYCNTQQLVRKSSNQFCSTAASHTPAPASHGDKMQCCKPHSHRHTQSTRLTDATCSQEKSLLLLLQSRRILGEFLLLHFKSWSKFLIHPQPCSVILPPLKCQRHCSDFKLILNPSFCERKWCPRD